MRKHRFPWKIGIFVIMIILGAGYLKTESGDTQTDYGTLAENVVQKAKSILDQEPEEVQKLRTTSVSESQEGSQEYYFGLLNDTEKKIYREMLEGIQQRKDEFYITTSDEAVINKVYHALLDDHAELFWVHNREQVYTSSYPNEKYCKFTPGYTYTDEEVQKIQAAAETALSEIQSLLSENAGEYEKVQTVYTYLIDHTEYASSDDDQNIAGVFWKNQAVCAGYARATQYLLEKLGIYCIYVEGSAANNADGHAWNIVQIGGQYYYVDTTNGDQPQFLDGDAVQLAEHKTIIYDYLCPFPEEYRQVYTPSDEFRVPECSSTDMNFYVLNDACFETYDYQNLYDFCKMRLDNGAAVVRFKFSGQEAFEMAKEEWIQEESVEAAARYYMQLYGLTSVQYHYGILENLKTIYFMF